MREGEIEVDGLRCEGVKDDLFAELDGKSREGVEDREGWVVGESWWWSWGIVSRFQCTTSNLNATYISKQ